MKRSDSIATSPYLSISLFLFLAVSMLTGCTVNAEGSVQDTIQQDTVLTIATWSGPYEAAQQQVLFTPFELSAGVSVQTQDYFGGLDALRASSPPDLVDMLEEEALVACQEGLLATLDKNRLLDQGSNQEADFLDDAFSTCSIAHLTFSTVVAYDERAFTGEKPQHIADLFDVKRFPGKRALKKDPSAILEWALMAEGVPNSQVYDLLSTERGMRIALRRLSAIRDDIVWWDTPSEAVAFLENGEAVMASGYNGRFFDAWHQGTPINMIWHGQIIDRSVWVVSAQSRHKGDLAHEFIRFAVNAQRQAKIAERIPYGPTRKSAFSYIGLHPQAGIVMTEHLPTASHHVEHALFRDTRWYAQTHDTRLRHFNHWLEQNQQPARQ